MGDEAIHDEQAGGDQCCAEVDEQSLPSPDQIHQMAERHFQRPGNARPEGKAGQEGGGEPQVFLDEKGADNAGQARDAGGEIDHQRRQEGPAKLADEVDEGVLDEGIQSAQHCIATTTTSGPGGLECPIYRVAAPGSKTQLARAPIVRTRRSITAATRFNLGLGLLAILVAGLGSELRAASPPSG